MAKKKTTRKPKRCTSKNRDGYQCRRLEGHAERHCTWACGYEAKTNQATWR